MSAPQASENHYIRGSNGDPAPQPDAPLPLLGLHMAWIDRHTSPEPGARDQQRRPAGARAGADEAPILALMSGSTGAGDVDIAKALEPYWRRRWMVVAIIVLIPAAVYGISHRVAKTYDAATTLLVRSTNAPADAITQSISVQTGSATAAARLVETTATARVAAQLLDEPQIDAARLLSGINVSVDDADTNAQFMTIAFTATEAQRAADLANAFAAAITQARTRSARQAIDRSIEDLKNQRDEIEPTDLVGLAENASLTRQLEALLSSQNGTTQVIERATPAASPISPRAGRNASLGLILAVLIAAAAAPAADRINRRLREPDELEGLTGTQLLAAIPDSAFPGRAPSATTRESFATLRASLRYFNLDRSLSVIVVTSPMHADGKTTVATNLAIAMARDGEDVVLVDADLRKPRTAARLDAEPVTGLESVLVDEVEIDDALIEVGEEGATFRLLASTSPAHNPTVLLGSKRMRELLALLSESASVVIVDTPPLLAVSDAIPLVSAASGVILVAQVGQTKADAIRRTTKVVESAEGTLIGAVATGVKGGGFASYGYYGYGYGYSDHELESPEGGRAKRRLPPLIRSKG